jgi:TonB family protein
MRLTIFTVSLWFASLTVASTAGAQTAAQNAGTTQSFGPAIQFDTRGVEFGPWIRIFVAQVKRHWFVPFTAMAEKGHVVVIFDIQKDGTITDVKIRAPSTVAAFNNSARAAIVDSNPTQPLPQDYPDAQAHFTVTFYYNESPPTPQSPASTGASSARGSNGDATVATTDPQFRGDVRRFLEVSGATSLSLQFGDLMAGTIIDAIKRSQPNIPDRAVAIVKEVVRTEMAREMTNPDGIQEQLVDLYARHFTQDEVAALLAFYSTPVGQKALATTPLMVQESFAIGQKWAQANAGRFRDLLQERLRAEGLIK